ncbi:unnamed protein product [Rhizophagus irregularis]|nr:unnamed protein product [Rhizophagus irregularis]
MKLENFHDFLALKVYEYITRYHQERRKTLNLVDLNILDSLVKDKKDCTQTYWNNKKKVTKSCKRKE